MTPHDLSIPTSYSPLFEPIQVGSIVLRNRLMMGAHKPNYLMDDQYVDYLAERVRGGAGLVVTGGASVHPKGEKQGHLPVYDDSCVPEYRHLADEIHALGGRVFVQLYHCGHQDAGTDKLESWHPAFSASTIPSATTRRIPVAMELPDIAETVTAFGAAAYRMRIAGVDGVELSGSNGYLLAQFLSPLTNRRTDDYGGSVAKRCRIVIEVAEEVRRQCGRDYPVGIRMTFDELLGDAGQTPELAEEALILLRDSKLLDFVNVSMGNYSNPRYLIPPDSSGLKGHFVPNAARAKAIVGQQMAVMVAGAIRDVELATDIVATGKADIVGMIRAQIADPEFANKLAEGRVHEIRRCVGANQGCLRRIAAGLPMTCTVNPVVGREGEFGVGRVEPADYVRSIIIVGGGPAGMKAAEAAARRGHRVTLLERDEHLGGQLLTAGRLPGREAWLSVATDLATSLSILGVEVRLGVDATAPVIEALAPDAVVVATGARFDRSGFSILQPQRGDILSGSGAHLLDPAETIIDPEQCGRSVLIADDNGDFTALGLALLLAERGRTVHLVTPHLFAGTELLSTSELAWIYPRVVAAGVHVHAQSALIGLQHATATIRSTWGGPAEDVTADTVVLSLLRESQDDLYHEVSKAHETARVGDCVAPREVDDAMYEGLLVGSRL